jgi:hypothetical protein
LCEIIREKKLGKKEMSKNHYLVKLMVTWLLLVL